MEVVRDDIDFKRAAHAFITVIKNEKHSHYMVLRRVCRSGISRGADDSAAPAPIAMHASSLLAAIPTISSETY